MWRRERIYHPSTDTYSDWSYTRLSGVQGEQGPAGTPGFLGLYADGETLHLKGYGADGVLDQSVGYIYVGGERIAVPATSLALTGEGTGYILFNNTWTNKVVFAKIEPQGANVLWRDYNDPSAIPYSTTNTFIIGRFFKDVDGISELVIPEPVSPEAFTKSHFMEIMASRDWGSFNVWAEALGVVQTFRSLAVWDLFVDSLTANTGFIENLGTKNLKLIEDGSKFGSIYSDYYLPSGQKNPASQAKRGVYLDSYGRFKAVEGELIGSLKTGEDAPAARVGIRDEVGIIEQPIFHGTGVDDFFIKKMEGIC